MAHTATDIVQQLGLRPLEPEGGFFLETFRDAGKIEQDSLPSGFDGARCFSTSILYLLPAGKVWHFYLGRPIVVSEIRPDGSLIETTLGSDLASGQKVQHVIRPGAWFGAHIGDPATGGPFAAMQKESDCALVGATVAPGFEYADFELGDRAELLRQYPQHQHVIKRLLPDQ